ncbi:hypothetical protein NQ315_007980 [Exocentrus adspersus]|uniref:Pinin n=1 Tax=Exocentrus adspersus TaxID=1586481 RepID=A0AAV8VFE9_9CUCU|nr:hypothetical protein NQ315_007980 [Exocentrus adspersus]
METEVLNSFDKLTYELEQAKSSLKAVDENIKKLIGRDPSDFASRLNKKRLLSHDNKGRADLKTASRIRNIPNESELPASKRRNTDSVFSRLSGIVPDDIHHESQKQIISKVIVTSKEIPSREEALEAQNKDEKFRARNKRMFGALLGTLQKFQQEETKLKSREEKRAQVEKKIEEHEIKEKEEIKKERHELFLNRKKKQIEIKIIELKMAKMREHTAWIECQKPRINFIMTKTDPKVHYLPRRLNNKTTELLNTSKQEIQAIIETKRKALFEELKSIEDKIRRNFNNKYGLKSGVQNEELLSDNLSQEHDDHFDKVMTELSVEENESKDVNEATEEVQYDGTNQDKENKQIDNFEEALSENEITNNKPNIEVCDV